MTKIPSSSLIKTTTRNKTGGYGDILTAAASIQIEHRALFLGALVRALFLYPEANSIVLIERLAKATQSRSADACGEGECARWSDGASSESTQPSW
jgi:hypothetical protein